MVLLTYPDMTFEEAKGASGEPLVRCRLFSRYYFDLPRPSLEKIGLTKVEKDSLEFDAGEKRVANKAGLLIEEGIVHNLKHQLYAKPAFYISEESGVPLIGSNEFGVVDRGSNIIEIKPLTGCNFSCTYCSVDEGKNSKLYDYLVDEEYLVKAAAEVAATKTHPVEFNIGPHGEPLLYPKIVELVRDLRALPNVGVISVNTNGSLLSKKLIDDLAEAGLTRVNLSIPALDEELASELAGVAKFPMKHLLEMLEYGKTKVAFLLAPVVVPGKNEQEMKRIVELSKSITSPFPTVGIQKYLEYPKGRKPVKTAQGWDDFFALVKDIEKETGKPLTATNEDFRIHEEKELAKPFRKNDVVEAVVVMPGRYPQEMYAAAQGRAIDVQIENRRENMGRRIKVRLVRDKHNIYKGVPTK